MSFNPFDQSIGCESIDSVRENLDAEEMAPPAELLRPEGKLFVYDLETVPDEQSYPRPEPKQVVPRAIVADQVLKTISTLETELQIGLPKEQLEDLLLAEQSGKCRKGAIDVIQKAIEGFDSDFESWHKLGTQPWSCRIVAMGILVYGNKTPASLLAHDYEEERELLKTFWAVHENGRRCGYNIRDFDDRVIVARSMVLGVKPSMPMSSNRYDKNAVDLMQMLFGSVGNAIKLKTLVARLGIDVPAGDMDGSKVLELVDSGNWDLLRKYVESDVIVEMELYKRTLTCLEL